MCVHYNGLLILILQSRSVSQRAEAGEALLPNTVFDREKSVVAAAWLFVSGSQTSLLRRLLGNPGRSHRSAATAFPRAGWEMIYRRGCERGEPERQDWTFEQEPT